RFLAATARRLADEENKKEKIRMKKITGSFAVAGFRKSYLAGFVTGISERLRQSREQMVQQNAGMSLVIRTAEDEVQDFLANKRKRGVTSKSKAGSRPSGSGHVFHAGKEAAMNVPLNSPISGATTAPRALPSGS